jgi:hypothetical protein
MLLYRCDPASLGLIERTQFEAAKQMHGRYPPVAMLVYAWMEDGAPSEPIPSPYSDRVRLIAVRRGAAEAGPWLRERRNHREDFRAAFGRDPGPLEGVALMVDTDNTHGAAEAWFAELRFLPEAVGNRRERRP